MKTRFTQWSMVVALLIGTLLNAQTGRVGINTESPTVTLEIARESSAPADKVQGVLFPKMTTTDRTQMQNVPVGTMIYNTTKNCIEYYDGTYWQCSDRSQKDFEYNGKWYNADEYVKDRNFGDGEHDFIYKVITGPTGKKWLNNNLGADYANVHSPVFNPDQQATSRYDYHAYGSLFQWQRKADGHELITWSDATNGTPKYDSTDQLAPSWTDAGTNKFIFVKDGTGWVRNGISTASGANLELWTANGVNNPCPRGFHVPSFNEDWVPFFDYIYGPEGPYYHKPYGDGSDDPLRLTPAGTRNYFRGWDTSGEGHYASTSYTTNNVELYQYQANLRPDKVTSAGDVWRLKPQYTGTVRCVQD